MRPVLAKVLVVLGVTLLLGFIGYAAIQNRDRNRVFLERINPHTYVTTDLPKLLYLDAMTNPQEPVSIDPSTTSIKNECLNGKDPKHLTTKEQLLEFIHGPCLPVVAVPGLLATKLAVKIDCETFAEHNPEIFKACGWKTCNYWKIWNSMPKEDYTLWISDFFGPVSILFQSSVKCWGNIIQLNVDSNEPDLTKKYTSPKGVTISIYGESEKDQSKSKCGFGAISNLMPIPYQTGYSKGFDGIYRSFMNMGYQPGLTLFATPYDWRKTTLANGITDVLRETVHQIHELTGKPSVLIAHSMGNFGTLHLLNSLSKEEKEKYIANYVSVTNPLAGSPKALKTFLGGDKDYIYKKFGINFYAQRMLIKGSSGAFDLLPKNTYSHFADTDWLQEWKSRSDLENNNDVRTSEGRKTWEEAVEKGDYGYKWFPHPLLNCSKGFEQRRDECGLYMYNWSKTALATIQDKSWTASQTELRELFNEFVLATNYSDTLFEDIQSHNIFQLKNPEVPVTLIYGSHLWTDMTYKWDYDPRENTRKDEFAFSTEILYSQGDQTVPTSSALLPALKWSWEFDNKEKSQVENPKPVKTVEICSLYNNKVDIYDRKQEDSAHEVLHNEYIGLKCDCFNEKNDHPVLGQSCDHADILNDSKFLTFLTRLANANHRVKDTSDLIINGFTDQDLEELSKTCPSVGRNSRLLEMFEQEVKRVKDIPTKQQIQA